MANILINGLKAKAGGGQSIFNNYLELIKNEKKGNVYYVLTPDGLKYKHFESSYLQIIDIPHLVKGNLLFPILYKLVFPRILKKYNIDAIFNLGDIIIPTTIPQVYLFQWAYAVYPETSVWERMNLLSYLTRWTKVKLINKNIYRPKVIIAQTANIKKRLENLYSLDNVVIIPNAVSIENIRMNSLRDFNLPKDRVKLVYVASWADHKNIGIIIPLALEISRQKLPYCVVVTIDPSKKKEAKTFLKKIRQFDLGSIIINVGRVPMQDIGALYSQCDALLMPTLLESYGLPYIEALYHSKTILTSDMDFAHDVCGEAAFYFNPEDHEDILRKIIEAAGNKSLREEKIKIGRDRISDLLTWEQVFERYQTLLKETLQK